MTSPLVTVSAALLEKAAQGLDEIAYLTDSRSSAWSPTAKALRDAAAGGHVVTSPWRDGLPRDCIVCGHPTQDVTYSGGRKTPRCADFQPCADRRDAGRARPRTEAGRRLKASGQEGGPSDG